MVLFIATQELLDFFKTFNNVNNCQYFDRIIKFITTISWSTNFAYLVDFVATKNDIGYIGGIFCVTIVTQDNFTLMIVNK